MSPPLTLTQFLLKYLLVFVTSFGVHHPETGGKYHRKEAIMKGNK